MTAIDTTMTADLALSQARAKTGPRPDRLAPGADPARVRAAARDFEAMFVTQMLQHMFAGIETDGLFGGGHGEKMFRSMMLEEYGKIIAERGIGIADAVTATLLRTQEVDP